MELENEAEATIDLAARFLGYVAKSIHQESQSTSARTALLLNVLKHFTVSYLTAQDIHSLTESYPAEARKDILASYFRAVAVLEEQNVSDIPRSPSSALLNAAASQEASVYALFGGQGTNEVYFDELQNLYDIYTPYVEPFLRKITLDVLIPLTAQSSQPTYYSHGMDVASWLAGRFPRPSISYLASVPLSLPLIGLTQLTQYLVACRVANITPGELRDRIAGATGHSQGVVSAVAIAASDSFESFETNAHKALRWLFFCGMRGQEQFPVLALDPSIVQNAVDGGEGAPSPMLAVTGLALKDLEKHIKSTNAHLPENSQLHVSLHNGPRAFVITGTAKALYGLVTSLRKVRAPSGLDQSKIPFSQRKPVFSVRFLVVGVPYHSPYLTKAVDQMVEGDLNGEDLWKKEEIAIPVYHTEDGECCIILPFNIN